jgi:predicted Zn finger-like uncharacterized protein
MAFEERTEELVCPTCGAKHRVRWSRMPVRERSTVECLSCTGLLFAGNTVKDYYQVDLL